MKIINTISNMIEDELDGAEEYITCALHNKSENPKFADVLYSISSDEMKHVNLLHTEVANLIAEYRDKNGEPPASMLAVYEYLHKKHIDHASKIKAMQMLYKET